MTKYFTIGEVSKLVGLTSKTIRYYESIQLIAPSNRQKNNYRLYTEQDIQKLRLIVEAKNLGIPLNEVKNIITVCFTDGCFHLKDYLKKRIPEYLLQTEQKIAQLKEFRKRIDLLQHKLEKLDNEDCVDCSDKNECYKYLQVE